MLFLFFSMDPSVREKYIVPDFPTVIFHGGVADFQSGNSRETICFIFSEILGAGRLIEEWIDDRELENIGLEEEFSKLYKRLYDVEVSDIWENWESTRESSKGYIKKIRVGKCKLRTINEL